MIAKHCRRLALLLWVAAACPALAQELADGIPESQVADAHCADTLAVPDYIKPGFQLLYASSSSSENPDRQKPPSAGQGYTLHTVVAVTKDKVLMQSAEYLAIDGLPLDGKGGIDPDIDPKVKFMAGSSFAYTAMQIQAGSAAWMNTDDLRQLKTDVPAVEVVNLKWPYQGKETDATMVGINTKDSILINTWRSSDGILLLTRHFVGPQRREGGTNYNRVHQSSLQLLDTRQDQSPIIGAAWPEWTDTVKAMRYTGTYTSRSPGSAPLSIGMSHTAKITEHGDGYKIGKTTIQVQGAQPTVSPLVVGPGTLLGYWIHPDVLNNLDAGEIDKNKHLRTSLTYKVQEGNLGKLGVFVQTNATKSFVAIHGYNLQNGALTYISLIDNQLNTTTEFILDGIDTN